MTNEKTSPQKYDLASRDAPNAAAADYDPTNSRNDVAETLQPPTARGTSRNWALVKAPPPEGDGEASSVSVKSPSLVLSENTSRFTVYYQPTTKPADSQNETPVDQTPSQNTKRSSAPNPVPAALENWQAVLSAHSDGKANLREINPEFGERLAKTFVELDTFEGGHFKGRYDVMSAYRSFTQQAALYNGYGIYDSNGTRTGSTHVVATPGSSCHELGCATDIEFRGNAKDTAAFYAAFHQIGETNGLQFVKDDINHVQLNDPGLIQQLRHHNTGSTQLASTKKPKTDMTPVFST